MTRKFIQTSNDAHESVKDSKNLMYDKIIAGMRRLRVGGNFETIAISSGIEAAQCHKRLPEMVEKGMVYNTGVTHLTSKGRKAMVRQLSPELLYNQEVVTFTQKELFNT